MFRHEDELGLTSRVSNSRKELRSYEELFLSVEGKNAIVTGASSGLGRQFALCLAEQGANVCICARRAERLEEVKKEVEAYGVKCLAHPTDVSDQESVKRMAKAAEDAFGRIDILINNAGAGFSTPAIEADDGSWEKTIDTNVNGVFYCCREVGKIMLRQNYGKIVNIGSFHCVVTMNGVSRSAYSTSKGAVLMMSKALAAEWAKHNITVNVLEPGYFASEMAAKVTDQAYEEGIRNGCPMGRRGNPGELNGTMLYLASDVSSYVTGQLVLVDGGWTIV